MRTSAAELGENLSAVFNLHITDKTQIENIVNDRLKENHRLITEYSKQIQNNLNKKAKISLKPITPEIRQDKIDGITKRLVNEDFESIKWILGAPVVTFSQSIVDEMVEKNAKFQYDSGLDPVITRKETGKCCKWCKNLAGVYKYPNVPKEVYRRHARCRCTVEYDAKKGKIQNVHTKKLREKEKNDRISNYNKSLDGKIKMLYNKAIRINRPEAFSKALLEKVSILEPQITSDMKRIVGKDRLAGLEFRKKTVSSLARKIETDSMTEKLSLSEATDKINDALRYTTILQSETFATDYHKIKKKLLSKGYRVVKVKNTWLGDSSYKGVNTVLEKNGLSFEMQYHTKESFELKNGELHELYEKYRSVTTPPNDRGRIFTEMLSLSKQLTIPNGIEEVK